MQKLKCSVFIFSICSLFFLLLSCDSEDISSLNIPVESISNDEVSVRASKKKVDCVIEVNNLSPHVVWDESCEFGTLRIGLCCPCEIGERCELVGGLLEMQTEEGPFSFKYYEHEIPWVVVPVGRSCYTVEWKIEVDFFYITQMWFNGEKIEFTNDVFGCE